MHLCMNIKKLHQLFCKKIFLLFLKFCANNFAMQSIFWNKLFLLYVMILWQEPMFSQFLCYLIFFSTFSKLSNNINNASHLSKPITIHFANVHFMHDRADSCMKATEFLKNNALDFDSIILLISANKFGVLLHHLIYMQCCC